ncbi:hypothetical protein BGW36DRAFT_424441 [Talaromyces proteolyticus]|uniref:DUF6606 domain-containing protein n=1 Tax=Talaromyces proteolyticus TaxID=1131652 RepID=A0AAD4PZ20_9EURO|nr:uncharacterized protein BGW36DRAFT_424441 [Talaromyces proteolyticus]KAH8702155.1 hypothetical protein BGW36DRAFT_424441 [Talaromyces proteolyticus]
MEIDSATADPEDVHFLYINALLPPQLPGEEENDVASREEFLLSVLRHTVVDFKKGPGSACGCWNQIEKTLDWCTSLRSVNGFSGISLFEAFNSFRDGDYLILFFRALESILAFEAIPNGVIVAYFSVVPPAETVMSHAFVLIHFPSQAIQIQWKEFKQKEFLEQLSNFLERLDYESPKSTEMSKPKILSELLMSILLAQGRVYASQKTIFKKIRDSLSTYDGQSTWRRSPFYLALKVVVQLRPSVSENENESSQYKEFMLFFLSKIAKLFLRTNASPEMLQLISNKLARRVCKSESFVSPGVMQIVKEVTHQIYRRLQSEWKMIRTKSLHSIQLLEPDPEEEICLELSSLVLEQIEKATNHRAYRADNRSSGHEMFKKIPTNRLELPSVESLEGVKQIDFYALADFEHWVEYNLDAWTTLTISECLDKDYRKLSILIQTYISQALSIYRGSVEHVMLLTSVDLGVALDRLTCERFPFFKQLSPEIPKDFLIRIYLNKERDFKRSHRIEEYVAKRHAERSPTTGSVFTRQGPIMAATLPELLYDDEENCTVLKELENRISDQNSECRREKLSEWESLSKKYAQLQDSHLMLEHDRRRMTKSGYHSKVNCEKCKLKSEASSLTIEVGEESLPSDPKFMLFEMRAPAALVFWRDATWAILDGISNNEQKRSRSSTYDIQSKYEALQTFWTSPRPRLQVMSLIAPPARGPIPVSKIIETGNEY